eukprot:3714558-Prymnesium_polylepis.1
MVYSLGGVRPLRLRVPPGPGYAETVSTRDPWFVRTALSWPMAESPDCALLDSVDSTLVGRCPVAVYRTEAG